ncbi:MAG TPA: hypothetical protein VGW38_07350, partial [Chloroflexota bacterium]|nr:hypothetical protein [Chloroflexota bacterium]
RCQKAPGCSVLFSETLIPIPRRVEMPKSQAQSVLSLALLVLGTACQSLVEPRKVVPVEFAYGVHRLQTEPAFLVDARADAVVVRGYLLTPCQPYNASASAEAVEGTLVLRVIGKATGECPQDVVSSVGYQATLRTAASAYTHLRVVHEWRDANWPNETVVDTVLSQ